MKRIEIFLGDREWDKADSYCEAVLDYDPECAMAYVYKLLTQLKLSNINLLDSAKPFKDNINYKKAIKFADYDLRKKLERFCSIACQVDIKKRKEEDNRNEEIYKEAMALKDSGDFFKAAEKFNCISGYKDSKKQSKIMKDEADKQFSKEERKLYWRIAGFFGWG